MTKNKKIFLIFIDLILMLLCTVGIIFSLNNWGRNVVAQDKEQEYVVVNKINLDDSVFLDEYSIDSIINLPENINISYNSEDYLATNPMLIYPDGTTTFSSNVKLDKFGDYFIRYFFKDSLGKNFVVEKAFSVSDKLYNVSANGSIVAVTSAEQADKEFGGNNVDVMYNKQDGLIVKLAEGDTFSFTKSIDLTQLGEDGLCDLISLDYRNINFVPNEKYDETDSTNSWKELKVDSNIATYCIVRLSDSYDLSNYIELYCRLVCPDNNSTDINSSSASKSSYYAYFSACAVGQVRTALTRPIDKEYVTYYNIDMDGERYGLYYKNEKGGRSFSNVPLVGTHTPFTWKYDYKTNKIYVQQGKQVAIVSALSSSEIYGANTFSGFSSGKVKLSIYMSEYVSSTQARVDISSIGSFSGKDLVNNFDKIGFSDDVAAPVINLDIANTDENGIYVPLHSEYILPKAQIISNEDIITNSINVYANYGTLSQIDIPIINGKIKIDKNRVYTAVYTVKNAAGCVESKILKINPVDVQYAISLDVSFDGLNQVEAGKKIILPNFKLDTINDKESLGVKIKAVHNMKEVYIDTETREFIPEYSGEYTIVYECFDNVFDSIIYKYSLNCVASNAVAFIGDFALPRYFIKGASYTLNEVPAYYFGNGVPEQIDFYASISYDNGETFNSIDYRNVKITGSETAIIKFICEKGTETNEIISDPVEIIDVGYGKNTLRIRDYFVRDGFETMSYEESNSTSVQYNLAQGREQGVLKFVNAVDYSSLNVAFKIPKNYANYQKINLILTDVYDLSKTYTVSYINKADKCYVQLEGGVEVLSSYKFEDSVTKKLLYDTVNNVITLNDIEFTNIDLQALFNSKLCYLDIEILGAHGDAAVIVDSINLQALRNNKKSDNMVPRISFDDVSGEYHIGDTIWIDIPVVTDVLSTVLIQDVILYVEKDGQPVYSIDGISMDGTCSVERKYQIRLDAYGQYNVTIMAMDGFGLSTTFSCYISVVDLTAPVIQLNTAKDSNISVGDVFTINYSVSDDICNAEQIVISILARDMKTNAFYSFNSNKIRFNRSGSYEIYVYAKDASGNVSYEILKVVVGE